MNKNVEKRKILKYFQTIQRHKENYQTKVMIMNDINTKIIQQSHNNM